MAVVRLIFRPCVGNHPTGVRLVAGNHPSGRSASSSPQGAPISHLMFALSATQTEWWFPVQNLKINMARPANGPMASIGPYKWFLCLLRGADGRQLLGPSNGASGTPPPTCRARFITILWCATP